MPRVQIIDPNPDYLIQHLAIKDPRLYEALTHRVFIDVTIDDISDIDELVVTSLKTAEIGQRVEIDGTNGIRIYDAFNALNVQLNGTALTIKTATTGQRLEIDPLNGLRIFSAGGLQSQFLGAAVTLPNSVILTQHLIDDAVTNLKIADDAVRSAQVQDLAIIAGKLAVNSVVAANIVAGSVTAIKINVSQLSAISADIGNITAGTITSITLVSNTITGGTITGTVFKTATSGLRVEIDSVNGFRAYDSGGTLTVQLNGSTLTFGSGLVDGSAITNSTIVAGKLNVSTLSAISADLGSITAGSITSITINSTDITGGTITGTLFQTASSGDRIEISNATGFQMHDAGGVTRVQIQNSVYGGLLINGIRSIDANDVFVESQDQSAQFFVSSASHVISFVVDSVGRGYLDNHGHETGGGNLPSGLVLLINNTFKRINCQQGTGPGFGYLYAG